MIGQTKSVNKLPAQAKRYLPVTQVSFHTEDKCYQVRGISKGYDGTPDPTDQLISVTTSKTLGSPAGTFTVTLSGDGWFIDNNKPVLKPNDLVIIYMGYLPKSQKVTWIDGTTHVSSVDLSTVMIGLVDTVTCTRNGGGSGVNPTIQTTVVGRDFGKLLIKAMLKFYPQLGSGVDGQKFFLTETGWITLMKAFTNDNIIKGSPAKVLDTIMRFILKQIVSIKWKVYDEYTGSEAQTNYKTVELSNMLRYGFAQTNFFIPFFMSAQQYEGSVWNLMDRVNIKPFTELFIDTRDRWEISNSDGIPQVVNETVEESSSSDKGDLTDDKGKWAYPATMFGQKDGAQVYLAYRNTPFDKSSWDKLRSHDLAYVDVVQESLSYSDNENYNLFWAGTTLTPFSTMDLKYVTPPILNKDNVLRYGLNPLEVTVEGLELDKSLEDVQKIALGGLSNDLNAKLKAWYENNVSYLSGNLTIRGDGSYKIGQKLNHVAMGMQFYIEAVTQTFQVYGDWVTQLEVTRGTNMPAPDYSVYLPKPPDPPKPATQQPTPSASYYTVKKGDTLWAIAIKYYGSGTKWTAIWEANKSTLIARDKRNATDHGHWIYPGMSLRIP